MGRVKNTDPQIKFVHTPRTLGMFRVSADFLRTVILANSDFDQKYPGADHVSVHYDFDSDEFWFKFRHSTLPGIGEGEKIPFVHPPIIVRVIGE